MLIVEPIEHVDLNRKVYVLLKQKILGREFHGGDKLSVNDLADQLKVSRTPVKDAINRLAHEGFLEILPRRGTYVAPVTEQAVHELFELREALELWAAEKGVARASEQAIAEIGRVVAEGHRVVQNGGTGGVDEGEFAEQDERFHLLLMQQAGNQKLVEMYHALRWIKQVARLYYRRPMGQQMVTQLEHEQILKAYERRDLEALRAALKSHLTNGRLRALQLLKEHDGTL